MYNLLWHNKFFITNVFCACQPYPCGSASNHNNQPYPCGSASNHNNQPYPCGSASNHNNQPYPSSSASNHNKGLEYSSGYIVSGTTCLVCVFTLCKSSGSNSCKSCNILWACCITKYLVCAYASLSILYTIMPLVFRVTITTGVLAALLSVTPSLPQWAISMCLVVDLCRGRRSYRCLCSRRWFCCSSTLQTNLCLHTSEKPLVSVGEEYTVHVFCLECGVSWVRIPPEAAHFSLEKLHFIHHLHYIHDVV